MERPKTPEPIMRIEPGGEGDGEGEGIVLVARQTGVSVAFRVETNTYSRKR